MLKVSQIMRVSVYQPKRGRKADPATLPVGDLSLVGQVHQVVFSPDGKFVVGFLVRRPDVGGMIKREDAFLALDSFAVGDAGLVTTRGDESLDDAARARLGLDWDACILWTGMDAKTTDGKELGWVSDVEFSPRTGKVKAFFVGDGSVAESLVGRVVIPADMLQGYANGCMIVAPEAATLSLDGGLAAKAGEGYARAKLGGKTVVSKAGKTAGVAVERGARGLGRMIGKARDAVAPEEDEAQPSVVPQPSGDHPGASADSDELVEHAPVPSTKKRKKKSAKKSAAHAVGKRLGRTRGMFGSFMEEYKKASK